MKLLAEFIPNGERVEPVDAHDVHGVVARQIETENHDQVRQNENGAFEIIALSFSVHVRQEENAKNDGDHVPLWEDESCIC